MTGILFTTEADQTLFTTQTPALVNESDGAASVTYQNSGTAIPERHRWPNHRHTFLERFRRNGYAHRKYLERYGHAAGVMTYANETASGWQQQALTTPISIAANTTYEVSVNTGNTYYVATNDGLASQVINGDLSSVAGNNGVFGSPGVFPTNSYRTTNYFRDIVFISNATGLSSVDG